MTQAAGAADIPDADIEEMFYAPVGVCMQDGRDSMFAGCTTDGTTSTFKLRRYESYDGSCKGPYKLLTRTTADDCKRGSETFEKLGIGHMTWTCNK
ncbi:hypothetical protein EON64_16945 [archaeon]|nr:MAG: hypothetical protein EON64_16945 [archaeon]